MEAAVQDVRARLIAAGMHNPDTVLRTVSAVHADEVVMHEAEQLAAQYGEAYVVSPDTDLLVLAACSSARVGVVLMGLDRDRTAATTTTAAAAAVTTQWGCSWKTQGVLPRGASPGELVQRSGSGCGQLDFSYCLPADLAKEWSLPAQLLPLAAVCFGTDDTDSEMTLQLHSALLQQTVESDSFVKSFKGLSLDAKGREELLTVARAKSAGGERRDAHQYCSSGETCSR
jgi:phosphoribosylpyrophosphate synthetase